MVWVAEKAGRLTNSDTTQAQIQGFELTHSNIYPIYEQLEHVKGPVLQQDIDRVAGAGGLKPDQ